MYKYQEQALALSGEDEALVSLINEKIIGYSSNPNWHYFDVVLANPDIKDICIFGVYHGRDCAYLSSILKKHNRQVTVTGVDKFRDVYGDDWPDELRDKSWEQAGYGKPPSIQQTRSNLTEYGNIELVQDTAQHYLQTTEKMFDFIYIDVSHDYQTTMEVIKYSIPKLRTEGIIGGDDYEDSGNCKVKNAVKDSFKSHLVYHNWFWLARKEEFI